MNVFGLLRVYMHAADGRQVTVRYVRVADSLGVPAPGKGSAGGLSDASAVRYSRACHKRPELTRTVRSHRGRTRE